MPASTNDETRFAVMFRTHHDAVQSYCLRRLPIDAVNDAVAQVFLVAWRRIDDLPEDRELPWLYGVARNVVRNDARSTARQSRLNQRLSNSGHTEPTTPEAQIVMQSEHEAVLDALGTLSDRDQEILRLKTWEEMPNADIAVALGISERAVEMRIRRSRKRLAAAYERRHGRSSEERQSPFRRKEVSGER